MDKVAENVHVDNNSQEASWGDSGHVLNMLKEMESANDASWDAS
jgi:hypothetical protein